MLALTIKIDGRAFDALTASGSDAIGTHFRVNARVRVSDGTENPTDLLGKPFALDLETRAGEKLSMSGTVVGVGASYGTGSQILELDLGPDAEPLGLGRDSRVHLAMTSVDIGKALLGRAGLEATWPSSAFPKRPYTAQYREDDWSFLDRVTREDGMYSYTEHGTSGSKLTFADDSTKAPAVDGEFFHRTHHGLTTNMKWVSSLAAQAVAKAGAFTTRDRDPLKPKVDIEGKEASGDASLEVYAWPARLDASGDAKGRAKRSLESLRAQRVVVTGTSASPAIRCGKIFEIGDGPLPHALRRLFCIGIAWSFSQDDFSLSFTGVPADVPFRLDLRPTPEPPLGVETAFVRGASGQEIDADEHARVVVQPLWDRVGKKDETCSIPVRVGQAALARSMAIPRIGWSMLVGHLDGDVDRPWVVARLVDGTHPPPYKLPANMTQTAWQTLTSASDGTLSEIVFEDKKDAEQIRIHAAKDMSIAIGDNEARTIGNQHVLEVTKDRSVTVDADEKLTVSKDQTTTVKGAQTTAIDGSRSITIKGKEEATVEGSRKEATKSDRTIDIGKKRTVKVGGKMSAASKKSLTREVLKKLTQRVVGSWSTETDAGIVTMTKGDGGETVAGARKQNGKAGVEMLVAGDLKDTIAAAHTVTAKGSASEAAKGKMKLTVGAALSATAPEIELSADTEITIVCGGSTITMKGSEVSVKAPTVTVTGPLVSSDGATVKHNP